MTSPVLLILLLVALCGLVVYLCVAGKFKPDRPAASGGLIAKSQIVKAGLQLVI